jgi:transcription-repair coupling factor (superfamily II helicase)
MRVAEWIQKFRGFEPAGELFESFDAGAEWQSIPAEARSIFVAAAYRKTPRKILIVTANYDRSLAWDAKLRLGGVSDGDLFHLPSGTSSLFEDAAPEYNALSDRIGALRALIDPRPAIIIGSAGAVLERTLPADILGSAFIDLKPGGKLDPTLFGSQLINLGYEPAEPVRLPGQFSRRGGIIDVYVSGHDLPVRIELFDDEIESLRLFDPVSQRSTGTLPGLSLTPSRETLYTGEDQSGMVEMIRQTMEREADGLDENFGLRLRELVSADTNAIYQRVFFDRLDLYRPFMHPDSGCAVDLLGDDGLLILDEPLELESVVSRAEEELGQSLQARHARGEILEATVGDYMLPPEHLARGSKVLSMSMMNALPDWLTISPKLEVGAASLEPYRGRIDAFTSTLQTWRQQDFTVLFCTDQPNRAGSVLSQIEIFPANHMENPPTPGAVLLNGNLGGGFVFPQWKLAVVSDAELFGVARLRLQQKRFSEGAPIATLLDLKPGDYVVHINFGIGIFRGLTKRTIEGVEKEFLFIEYAAPDKLFVPAEQLDRIQKYLNPGDSQPRLNRLTGGEWQKTIGKAREDAKAFARDLVKLYAERRAVQRRPFGPDTPWQTEMEGTFPWVETPSQLQAIKDTKRDLQQDFPMDRLVCGDVGFGKTEVAIRAAFKVVQAGRQCVVLCPTTILSEQHARNFQDRLGPFGVRMAVLNRFRTTKERNEVLAQTKSGGLDLVIGTHALLSKEIEFSDLGLVIVDEEQKFGVKQKEALKQIRTNVDVLTMSATPIPRTLSMALMDIRQMSQINDPPPGRLPIRTFVRPFALEVVREAILRELARGGQIFYVYNRVEGIYHVAERLKKLVPTARIGVGHGQMTEQELEPVMVGFIKGEIDVLLSTTIVENGIDIGNANTLLVENADRLGLSQLYQLRGRVGRSDRQAYAYFLYQNKELNEGAMHRLQALQEFSQLGSGYSLAFRDLQIRGAGELLGAKQSGSMAAVGYELYTSLIEEAVKALKEGVDGTLAAEGPEDVLARLEPLPTIELPVVALIPDGYIREQAQRLYYYQRMMGCRNVAELLEVSGEIEDRYGHPPDPVKAAFEVMRMRMVCRDHNIEKVDARDGRLVIGFRDRTKVPPRAISILGNKNRETYVSGSNLVWPYRIPPIQALDRFLELYRDALAQVEEERSMLR